MHPFQIVPLDTAFLPALQHHIDSKTKPLGALGDLESVGMRLGLILRSVKPHLQKPTIIVFAADHGLADEGVSAYPRDVTWQMVQNFLSGGAAINVFARQSQLQLQIVNAGVDHKFADHADLINMPIAASTKNMLYGPAMTTDQCQQAIARGASIVQDVRANGSNMVAFGEMGIGNTSAAALIMSYICGKPLEECVGRGTGVTDEQYRKKLATLKRVKTTHGQLTHALDILHTVGGFEIAMMVGAYLQAAELGMVILVDGFIGTAALLVAAALVPEVLEYCIFSHNSEEKGHAAMLDYLQAKPLLKLHLRLGEGTGAALAYPLVESAARFMCDMASFESASVSNKPMPGVAVA